MNTSVYTLVQTDKSRVWSYFLWRYFQWLKNSTLYKRGRHRRSKDGIFRRRVFRAVRQKKSRSATSFVIDQDCAGKTAVKQSFEFVFPRF